MWLVEFLKRPKKTWNEVVLKDLGGLYMEAVKRTFKSCELSGEQK